MISLSIALIASSLSPAEFGERAASRIQTNYPSWALKEDQSVAAVHSIFVDPEGRVLECDILGAVGSDRLAKHLCQQIKRTRLEPAIDINGMPAFGRIVGLTKMSLPDTDLGRRVMLAAMRPDVELTVSSIPDGDLIKDADFLVQIDTAGKVRECVARNSDDALYGEAACEAVSSMPFEVGKDAEGTPVPYIREVTISFVVESGE